VNGLMLKMINEMASYIEQPEVMTHPHVSMVTGTLFNESLYNSYDYLAKESSHMSLFPHTQSGIV
jgi:hypothetical protein